MAAAKPPAPTKKSTSPKDIVAGTVKAQRVELVDESGVKRVTLGFEQLAMLDENGIPRVFLKCEEDGPGLYLNDAEGRSRAMLTVLDRNRWAVLTLGCDKRPLPERLKDPKPRSDIALVNAPDGSAILFHDEGGEAPILIKRTTDGKAEMSLLSEKENKEWRFP